jgi:hypothetical protein
MGYRRFEDEHGSSWEVWEVHPAMVERRLNADRRTTPRAHAEHAETAGRRQQAEVRFPIPRELEGGWLTFQTPTEKRRLAPIPAQWMTLSDHELAILCRRARPYRATPPGGFRRLR